MRVRTFTAMLMLLALVIACMVSVPVFSLEHPWDADGGNQEPGGTDDGQDTVIVDPELQRNCGCPDWVWNLVYASSYYFPGQLIGFVTDPAVN